MQVTPDFTLTARADRLDVAGDGGLAIIDYKTGTPPSPKEVRSLSPQLPLEALIARAGGFERHRRGRAEPHRLLSAQRAAPRAARPPTAASGRRTAAS